MHCAEYIVKRFVQPITAHRGQEWLCQTCYIPTCTRKGRGLFEYTFIEEDIESVVLVRMPSVPPPPSLEQEPTFEEDRQSRSETGSGWGAGEQRNTEYKTTRDFLLSIYDDSADTQGAANGMALQGLASPSGWNQTPAAYWSQHHSFGNEVYIQWDEDEQEEEVDEYYYNTTTTSVGEYKEYENHGHHMRDKEGESQEDQVSEADNSPSTWKTTSAPSESHYYPAHALRRPPPSLLPSRLQSAHKTNVLLQPQPRSRSSQTSPPGQSSKQLENPSAKIKPEPNSSPENPEPEVSNQDSDIGPTTEQAWNQAAKKQRKEQEASDARRRRKEQYERALENRRQQVRKQGRHAGSGSVARW